MSRIGGGYGLVPFGAGRLRAEFMRGRFRIKHGSRWQVFDTRVSHTFSMREHRFRYEETRAEERARMDGAKQQPDFYRRAFELVLDYGKRRFSLAAIASEDQARALLRRIHALDEFTCGDDGAGTRTGTDRPLQGVPTGQRPRLD